MTAEFIPPWNATINNRLEECPTSADKAAEFLKLAIEPLRKGEALQDPLANFLADAIETAMAEETTEKRIKTLTDKLYLTANRRRPDGNWLTIGMDFDGYYHKEIANRKLRGESDWGSITHVAKIIGKKYKIEQPLAKKYWEKWVEGKQAGEE